MIPDPVRIGIQAYFTEETGIPHFLVNDRPVSGGCIHNAHWIKVNEQEYFIKYNRKDALSNFQAEQKGLAALANTKTLKVPKSLTSFEAEGYAVLILQYINATSQHPDFWEWFGQGLAALHRHTQADFGLDHANFIGSLPQKNGSESTWLRFFIHQRLEPQLQLAESSGVAPDGLRRGFEDLYANLPNLLPADAPPSLLHGDLWSGNFMVGNAGEPVIFDPAVYYGHREAEIAFTRMFGGFDERFYTAYDAVFPLEAGWEERIDLFNLYPLLVHLNLFGRSYLGEIQSTLQRFA